MADQEVVHEYADQPETRARPGAPGTAQDVVSGKRESPKKPAAEKPTELKDPFREIIETIVFVVVLVFMLKTFLAEAFVIPTGSMATTLLGDHRNIVCQQCKYPYAINYSSNTQQRRDRDLEDVRASMCPNCGFDNTLIGGP